MTIDTHHHILPDFFWQATENEHAPVGGLAPLRWSKEASISFMDDAGIDCAVVSLSTPTNRAVAQMHYTNRFARTPNVKYIFSHAGGSIPYLAARFAIIDQMGFIPGGEQRGSAADMFHRLYWDTALSASDPVFRMLREVAGINQVLYGTDFPYLRRDLAINSKQRIVRSSELNDLERRAILGGNASRLFPAIPSFT